MYKVPTGRLYMVLLHILCVKVYILLVIVQVVWNRCSDESVLRAVESIVGEYPKIVDFEEVFVGNLVVLRGGPFGVSLIS